MNGYANRTVLEPQWPLGVTHSTSSYFVQAQSVKGRWLYPSLHQSPVACPVVLWCFRCLGCHPGSETLTRFFVRNDRALQDPRPLHGQQAEIIKDKIIHRLIAFSGGEPSVVERLESPEWADKPAKDFSFEVFSIIQLDSQIQQAILEDRSALSRLEQVLSVLNQS